MMKIIVAILVLAAASAAIWVAQTPAECPGCCCGLIGGELPGTDTPNTSETPTPTPTLTVTITATVTETPSPTPSPTPTEPRFSQSCYVGNGNDNRLIASGVTIPGLLFVQSVTGTGKNGLMWTPEMGSNSDCIREADGTQCGRTNEIQAVNSGTFEIGTSANVNESGQTYCWELWGLGTKHETFTYTGNGAGNRTITLTTIDPSAAIIIPAAASKFAYVRTADMAANVSYAWNESLAASTDTAKIRAFGSKSVTVGTDMNANGVVYYGAAWQESATYGDALTWTGNGTSGGGNCANNTDVRTITTGCSQDVKNIIAAGPNEANPAGCESAAEEMSGKHIGPSAPAPGNVVPAFIAMSGGSGVEPAVTNIFGNNDGSGISGATFKVRGPNGSSGTESLNDNTGLYYAFATCTGQEVIGTTGLADWSFAPNSLYAYHMEEATNATRTNNSCVNTITGGTTLCGFAGCHCDLAVSNTVDQDTTNKVIGNAAASFDGSTSTDVLEADRAVATEINIHTTQTWGGFVRPTSSAANQLLMRYAGAGGDLEYSVVRNGSGTDALCRVRNTSATNVDAATAGAVLVTNSFNFFACKFDDTANTITAWDHGAFGTGQTVADMNNAGSGAGLTIGGGHTGTGAVNLTGQMDEVFDFAQVLTSQDLCRICSCGVTGGACSCYSGDPTIYIDIGFNTSLCGSCALPACNKAQPS